MSEEHQPCKDPFYDLVPERMWLTLTNIGEHEKVPEGMVRLILEVNGQKRELYHSYVIDGTVCHSWNLTGWIKRSDDEARDRIEALESETMQNKLYTQCLCLVVDHVGIECHPWSREDGEQ